MINTAVVVIPFSHWSHPFLTGQENTRLGVIR